MLSIFQLGRRHRAEGAASLPAIRPEIDRGGATGRMPPSEPLVEEPEDGTWPLPAYAAAHSLTEAEVWRRLGAGELVGQNRGGAMVILAGAAVPTPISFLPPLPAQSGEEAPQLGGALAPAAPRAGASSLADSSTEMALLLDHLSLAKEENRDILRLTQESMRRVAELSDQIVLAKDQVIEARESELLALREQLLARDRQIGQLRQQCEDLEMLAKALAAPEGATLARD